MSDPSSQRAEIVGQADSILEAARNHGLPLWALGGVAIALRSQGPTPPALDRDYKDIDLITRRGLAHQASALMGQLGYEPDRAFNSLNGRRRLLFLDTRHERQIDIFVEVFEMCHTIPVADRLEASAPTPPLADLLLTKLQIVELNEKDQRDILRLLHEHPVSRHGGRDQIDAERIATLCAHDWGLWRTTMINLERARLGVHAYDLTPDERSGIAEGVEELVSAIDDADKSLKWRLRSRIGDRVRWYDWAEEVT